MATELLATFSTQLTDIIEAASPPVVQVQVRRRPAGGIVYSDRVVVTAVRALGREDGLHGVPVTGRAHDAELAARYGISD